MGENMSRKEVEELERREIFVRRRNVTGNAGDSMVQRINIQYQYRNQSPMRAYGRKPRRESRIHQSVN